MTQATVHPNQIPHYYVVGKKQYVKWYVQIHSILKAEAFIKQRILFIIQKKHLGRECAILDLAIDHGQALVLIKYLQRKNNDRLVTLYAVE